MSKFLKEYYGDTWRDRIVTHKTPTGRTSRVKVGSLSPEEQLKYNPNRFKRTKADTKMTKDEFDKIRPVDEKIRTMDVYISAKNLDVIEDIHKNIEEGKLILGTTDSKNVIDLFDGDLNVVKLLNVPVTAIKKYMVGRVEDVESIEDFEFEDAGDADEEKLYEISKFTDSTIFLLDLYPYLDDVGIAIDTADDDSDDFEELHKNESTKFTNFYLREEIENVIYRIEHLDSHSGQNNYAVLALQGDEPVGVLDFVEFNGEVSISMVEVNKKFRNQGIGRGLVLHLQNEYPRIEIEWGYDTDEGAKLHKSMIRKKELYVDEAKHKRKKQLHDRYNRLVELRKSIKEKLDVLYKDGNSDIRGLRKYGKMYDELEDEIWELEQQINQER